MKDNINKLIKVLIKTDSYITVSELADILNVSNRTVHNYLNSKQFNDKISGAVLLKKQNKGIILESSNSIRREILQRMKQDIPIQEHIEADFVHILLTLLRFDRPLNIDFLAQTHHMSTSNIRTIIHSIETTATSFGCYLDIAKGKGVLLKGNEEDIRSLFLFILLNHIQTIHQSSGTISNRLNKNASLSLSYMFHSEDIEQILKVMNKTELMMHTHFCDADYSLFAIQLLILIVRNQNEAYLETYRGPEISTTPEFIYATFISTELNNLFNIDIPTNELSHLARILMSLRKQMNALPLDYEIDIVDKFIEKIGLKLNADLSKSKDLKRNLLTHLRPAIIRMRHGVTSNNLLLEKIKHEFTDVYISVMTTIEDLEREEEVHFDANEIGFICLHIIASLSTNTPKNADIKTALICNEGLSLELFIKNIIESNFSSIEISTIIRHDTINELNASDYDIILNTSSLDYSAPNVVNISPQISEDDIRTIQTSLKEYHKSSQDSLRNDDYLQFFNDSINNKDDLISKYCKLLYDNNFVTEDFESSLLQRMKINNTYVARGIAVPHGHPNTVLKSTIMVVLLDKPIPWDSNEVQIVLFVVAENDPYTNFNQLLRSVMRIASSNYLTQSLLECSTKDQVYEILETVNKK